MDLWLWIGVLAVIAVLVYLARRRRTYDELKQEDDLTASLEDDFREKSTAWEESLGEYERDEGDGEE